MLFSTENINQLNNTSKAASREINLFCFPFSGASFYAYKAFEKYMPDYIRMTGTDLPGHGRRMREPLLTDAYEMVEDLWRSIKNDLDTPYAIYGHSLGATLGYLFTVKAIQENRPAPLHLFLSGRRGPSVPNRKTLHLLPKPEFLKELANYGGTPKEVLQEEGLMDFMEPILRSDFQAAETFKYRAVEPLSLPITVMTGLNDDEVTYEEASQWQEVTSHKISLRQFPGGHFFIFDHLPELIGIICQDLENNSV